MTDLLPGRSYPAIQKRASRIGITRNAVSSTKQWSHHEDDKLQRVFGAKSIGEVLKLLPGRTEAALRIRAKRLGVVTG